MSKLILVLALVVIVYRWLKGRWPWELRTDRQRAWARAQARAVLGVTEGASRESIVDAHRRVIAKVHPDRGGTSDLVHEANSARDLLLRDLVQIDRERA